MGIWKQYIVPVFSLRTTASSCVSPSLSAAFAGASSSMANLMSTTARGARKFRVRARKKDEGRALMSTICTRPLARSRVTP